MNGFKRLAVAVLLFAGLAMYAPIASEAIVLGSGALAAQVEEPEQPFLSFCVDICVWRNTDPEYCCD